MKVHTRNCPVWLVCETPYKACQYYRGLLPSRIAGGAVITRLPVSFTGGKVEYIDPFQPADIDRVLERSASVSIWGLGRPTILVHMYGRPRALAAALKDAGVRVVLDQEDWIENPHDFTDPMFTVLADNPAVKAKLRVRGLELLRHRGATAAELLEAERTFDGWYREQREGFRAAFEAGAQKEVSLASEYYRIGHGTAFAGYIASTDFLKAKLEEAYPGSMPRIGRNCVDTADFQVRTRPEQGPVYVGTGSSVFHLADMSFMQPALIEATRLGARACFWGSHPNWSGGDDAGAYQHEGLGYEYRGGFRDIRDYHRDLAVLDIGLCILAHESDYTRAKSPQRFFEYSLNGTATIASDTDPYRNVIRHGETGFLVRDPEELTKYVLMLVEDADLRRRIGAAARADVLANWTTRTPARIAEWRAAVEYPPDAQN